MNNYEIAKEAYKQIVKAIVDLEEKHQIRKELSNLSNDYFNDFLN